MVGREEPPGGIIGGLLFLRFWAGDDRWYGYWGGGTYDWPSLLWHNPTNPIDILDRLPSDPFNMGLDSTSSSASSTTASFTGRFADSEDGNVDSKVTEADVGDSSVEGGEPHEAILYALGYMSLKDLLLAERVCKTWRTNIQNDPLLWKNIYIEEPLNCIKDAELFRLVQRANGNLKSLTLINCRTINEECLRHVLEISPKLKRGKLSVPGCSRIKIENLIDMLKSLNLRGLKQLRINGLHEIKLKHYEELKLLLDADKGDHQKTLSPSFYHRDHSSLSLKDDRALDIEPCYMCGDPRVLFDCPLESCQERQSTSSPCRACINCIPRCSQCGRCINNIDYEETFCLAFRCWGCKEALEAVHGQEVKEE
ncbi:hypothetical protein QJS10_CPA16g00245 [Acorus calamus]|uniref:F-box domain-containing protein n=1 Tax=Acorus calamus TaxID=4465 RepID=A0AAV9D1V0_ACOCL|nr:hypothetical protein QJS10_CPA16g00245 [Acorus calamus]